MCDITIVIAVYNHEKYLKRAIRSVLMQKISCSYEVLIVDDYSTDSSRDILRSIEPTLPDNYRILYRPYNYGLINNYYDAVKQMNGRYFIILEGDDYWTYSLKLQRQYEFLEKHSEYMAVSHRFREIDENGKTRKPDDDYKIRSEYGIKEFCNSKLPGQTATILSRNYFRYGCFDYKPEFISDFDGLFPMDRMHAFFLAVYGRVYCIDRCWSVYRYVTSGGSSYSATVDIGKWFQNLNIYYRGCKNYVKTHDIDAKKVPIIEGWLIWNLLYGSIKRYQSFTLRQTLSEFKACDYKWHVICFIFQEAIYKLGYKICKIYKRLLNKDAYYS